MSDGPAFLLSAKVFNSAFPELVLGLSELLLDPVPVMLLLPFPCGVGGFSVEDALDFAAVADVVPFVAGELRLWSEWNEAERSIPRGLFTFLPFPAFVVWLTAASGAVVMLLPRVLSPS